MSDSSKTIRQNLAILISGRGSNMLALLDAIEQGRLNAEVAVVISDRKDAVGIELAENKGVQVVIITATGLSKEEHEKLIVEEIERRNVALICLAGYMRLLSKDFVKAFPNRIVNIHPSLLPAFPGKAAQRQALEYGVKVSGCTVHFVDEGCDTGPIILQSVVPVYEDDTEETLSARILEQEHATYAKAVGMVLDGVCQINGRRVVSASI